MLTECREGNDHLAHHIVVVVKEALPSVPPLSKENLRARYVTIH